MRMNQVTLPVVDMEKSVLFYQRMGFTQIVDTPHYARFECPDGGSTFSLILSNKESDGQTVIYFEHDDLDRWVDALKTKGFKFDQPPTDQSYLWREAILHDPSNNKIKLFYAGENRLNPPWRVDVRED